jgi:hypothetical protein
MNAAITTERLQQIIRLIQWERLRRRLTAEELDAEQRDSLKRKLTLLMTLRD